MTTNEEKELLEKRLEHYVKLLDAAERKLDVYRSATWILVALLLLAGFLNSCTHAGTREWFH